MMQFIMQPGMVYQYPIWGVGLLLVGLAALGTVLCELTVHQFLSIELRRRHNDVAAAIFSVVGVTFAVLLAFVAMLAWDGFNKATARRGWRVWYSCRPPQARRRSPLTPRARR
jgi:hypothetical protein